VKDISVELMDMSIDVSEGVTFCTVMLDIVDHRQVVNVLRGSTVVMETQSVLVLEKKKHFCKNRRH